MKDCKIHLPGSRLVLCMKQAQESKSSIRKTIPGKPFTYYLTKIKTMI